MTPYEVECPTCEAKAEEFCRTPGGLRCAYHRARIMKANGVDPVRLGGYIGAAESRRRGAARGMRTKHGRA